MKVDRQIISQNTVIFGGLIFRVAFSGNSRLKWIFDFCFIFFYVRKLYSSIQTSSNWNVKLVFNSFKFVFVVFVAFVYLPIFVVADVRLLALNRIWPPIWSVTTVLAYSCGIITSYSTHTYTHIHTCVRKTAKVTATTAAICCLVAPSWQTCQLDIIYLQLRHLNISTGAERAQAEAPPQRLQCTQQRPQSLAFRPSIHPSVHPSVRPSWWQSG